MACGGEDQQVGAPDATGGETSASGGSTSVGSGGSDSPGAGEAGGTLAMGSIVSGEFFTCAIGNAGQLACWGIDPSSPGTWSVPTGVFTQLASTGIAVLALRDTGQIERFAPPGFGVDLPVLDGTFVQIDAANDTLCGLDANGQASCIGPRVVDMQPPAGETFVEIGVGASFACGIRSGDGSIVCWGSTGRVTQSGECGPVATSGQLSAPSGQFVRITSRHGHSCAIRVDGSLACWGGGEADDDPTLVICDRPYNVGQSVPPAGSYVDVSAGSYHTCAIDTAGAVACWGAGTQDNDCDPDFTACGQALPPAGTFARLASGYTHTCAMRADRTVQCWGSDTGGRSTPPAGFP